MRLFHHFYESEGGLRCDCGLNVLHVSALHGYYELAKILLEGVDDVNKQGGKYGYALQAALSVGSKNIVTMLLRKGANVNAQGGKYGNTCKGLLHAERRRLRRCY